MWVMGFSELFGVWVSVIPGLDAGLVRRVCVGLGSGLGSALEELVAVVGEGWARHIVVVLGLYEQGHVLAELEG